MTTSVHGPLRRERCCCLPLLLLPVLRCVALYL